MNNNAERAGEFQTLISDFIVKYGSSSFDDNYDDVEIILKTHRVSLVGISPSLPRVDKIVREGRSKA